MSAPLERTSSGRIAFTVAAVPTGMNAGVLISPRSIAITPARDARRLQRWKSKTAHSPALSGSSSHRNSDGVAKPSSHVSGHAMPHIQDIDRFLFIVGAPRCGTTTMARWLQAHPQVLFPFVKEPHYFWQHDLRGLGDAELRRLIEHDYLDHFFAPPDQRQSLGDGCVGLLPLRARAARAGAEGYGQITVRRRRSRPTDNAVLAAQRLIFTGDENIRRFEDAWAAIPDRAAGRRIPWSAIEPRWLRYDEAARYGTYVEQLFAAVGKEQLPGDRVRRPRRRSAKVSIGACSSLRIFASLRHQGSRPSARARVCDGFSCSSC